MNKNIYMSKKIDYRNHLIHCCIRNNLLKSYYDRVSINVEKKKRQGLYNITKGQNKKSKIQPPNMTKLQLQPLPTSHFPHSESLSWVCISTHFSQSSLPLSFLRVGLRKCVRWGWFWYSSPPLSPASSSSETSNPSPRKRTSPTPTTTSLRIPNTKATLSTRFPLLELVISLFNCFFLLFVFCWRIGFVCLILFPQILGSAGPCGVLDLCGHGQWSLPLETFGLAVF